MPRLLKEFTSSLYEGQFGTAFGWLAVKELFHTRTMNIQALLGFWFQSKSSASNPLCICACQHMYIRICVYTHNTKVPHLPLTGAQEARLSRQVPATRIAP